MTILTVAATDYAVRADRDAQHRAQADQRRRAEEDRARMELGEAIATSKLTDWFPGVEWATVELDTFLRTIVVEPVSDDAPVLFHYTAASGVHDEVRLAVKHRDDTRGRFHPCTSPAAVIDAIRRYEQEQAVRDSVTSGLTAYVGSSPYTATFNGAPLTEHNDG